MGPPEPKHRYLFINSQETILQWREPQTQGKAEATAQGVLAGGKTSHCHPSVPRPGSPPPPSAGCHGWTLQSVMLVQTAPLFLLGNPSFPAMWFSWTANHNVKYNTDKRRGLLFSWTLISKNGNPGLPQSFVPPWTASACSGQSNKWGELSERKRKEDLRTSSLWALSPDVAEVPVRCPSSVSRESLLIT